MTASADTSGFRPRTLYWIYAAVLALLVVPVLVTTVPLGVDTLNHLSRIFVRAHIDTDADIARFYTIRDGLVPYLGMDLLLEPFARVMPILVVGRLYMLALAWGLVGTVIVLRLAFDARIGFAPALTGLIAYNGLLAWGLLNYALGLILALLLFAAWHRMRQSFWLTRLLLFTGAATILYITHVLAFVLYGILVGSYEFLGRPKPWRNPVSDWFVLVVQAGPSLLLLSRLQANLATASGKVEYDLNQMLIALNSPFLFRGAAGGMDIGAFTAILCGLLVYIGIYRKWLTCPRILAAPILVLLALTILVPWRAVGVALLDYRFPVAAVCLALAGLRVTPLGRRRLTPVLPVLAVLMVAHVADVSRLERSCRGQYAELRDGFAALPRGPQLALVLERTDPVPDLICTTGLPVYEHMAQLVAIDRSGYATDFFARVTTVAARDGLPSDTDAIAAEAMHEAPATGYVLWMHLGRHRPVPPGLTLVRAGSFFDLWAVTR